MQIEKIKEYIQTYAPEQQQEEWIEKLDSYWNEKQFYAALKVASGAAVAIPNNFRKVYQIWVSNIGLAVAEYLKETRRYQIAKYRTQMIQRIVEDRLRPDFKGSQSFLVDDDKISPPFKRDVVVFEGDLQYMPE